MSAVADLIGGAFAFQTAPFASHPLDKRRAAEYLAAAVNADVSLAEAEDDIRAYLGSKGCDAEKIEEELEHARPLLEPWLT